MSSERIHYDDDPADTAAEAWVFRTRLGRASRRLAATSPTVALRRAYRTGYLRGQQVIREEGLEKPLEVGE